MVCDLERFEYAYVNINPHVCITVIYISSEVSAAHRNTNVLLHFEIIQEFLMHSINVYGFSFRQ